MNDSPYRRQNSTTEDLQTLGKLNAIQAILPILDSILPPNCRLKRAATRTFGQ